VVPSLLMAGDDRQPERESTPPTQQTQPEGPDKERAENTQRPESEWGDRSLGVVRGTVKEWHEDDGWGVLVSPAVPGDVWAHLHMLADGCTAVTAGHAVEFEFIAADQDGFAYRATWVRDLDAS
jgi:cold shock CspA family protein